MTLQTTNNTTTNTQTLAGNVTFIFDYRMDVATDAVVTVDTVPVSGFAITGLGNNAGGSVTLVTAPTVGAVVVVARLIPETQDVSYPVRGAFPAPSHENAMDRQVMMIQQINEKIERSLRFPLGDAATSSLADVATRKNNFLSFDNNGNIAYQAGTGTDPNGVQRIGSPVDGRIMEWSGGNARDSGINISEINEFSVKSYGAVGDGVTDDSAAIQAGIDFLTAAGGGNLFFPKGVYLTTVPITMGNDIGLSGEGNAASIIKGNSLTTSVIRSPVPGTRYFRWLLKDIGIDNTSRAAAGGIGLDLTNITMGTFTNVSVTNVNKGVLIVRSGGSGGAFYNDFYSLRVITVVTGIDIGDTGNENRFFGGRVNDMTDGVVVDNNTSNSFYGMSFEAFTGTAVRVSPTAIAQYIRLNDLRIENLPSAGAGIILEAGAQSTTINNPMYVGLTTNLTDNGVDTHIFSDTSFKTGSGSDIRLIDKITATIDFPSIPAGSTSDQLIAVTGANTSDQWLVTAQATLETGLIAVAIPASSGVFVRIANVTTGAIDPASHTFSLTRIRYN